MVFRRGLLALSALLVATSIASAQTTPPKKKKPKKKPKVTQVAPAASNAGDDDDAFTPSKPDPPKLDTDLKETDTWNGKPGSASSSSSTTSDRSAPDYSGKKTTEKSPPDYSGKKTTEKSPPDYSGKKTTTVTASEPSSTTQKSPWSNASGEPSKDDKSKYPPRGKISANAFAGYASANLRIGFGMRAGYTLDNGLFLGGAFTYHLGTRFGTATESFFYVAPEIGYDYRATPDLTIRPYAGIGAGAAHTSDDSNILAQATTVAFFTFYPGVQIDFQLPRAPVFFGGDLRGVIAAGGDGSPSASVGFFVVAGARF